MHMDRYVKLTLNEISLETSLKHRILCLNGGKWYMNFVIDILLFFFCFTGNRYYWCSIRCKAIISTPWPWQWCKVTYIPVQGHGEWEERYVGCRLGGLLASLHTGYLQWNYHCYWQLFCSHIQQGRYLSDNLMLCITIRYSVVVFWLM